VATARYSRLLLAPEDAERASAALWRAGSLGGWEDEAAGAFAAAFADGVAARAALVLLRADGIDARLEEDVASPDPFALHRASLAPFSVGGFRIDPRGDPDGGSEGRGTLWIPAHGAFGTGLHASTRGILRWLDRAAVAGQRVLDVGCGSAILAIAAARRGAEAFAFDVDFDAVVEASRNLGRNGASRVRLFAGELAALTGAFDAILANMIWEESAPLVFELARLLRPGGTAVFSGILDEREADALRGISAAALSVSGVDTEDEWRTIVTVKRQEEGFGYLGPGAFASPDFSPK
jgi:ribosomal protein L11 methyltransferase